MRTLGAAEIALLAITCLLAACAGSGGGGGGGAPKPACKPPATTTVSFSANIQPIFNRSCALGGCHVGSVSPGSLNLQVGQAYGQIVGAKSAQQPNLLRIQPGKPDLSSLLRHIDAG